MRIRNFVGNLNGCYYVKKVSCDGLILIRFYKRNNGNNLGPQTSNNPPSGQVPAILRNARSIWKNAIISSLVVYALFSLLKKSSLRQ